MVALRHSIEHARGAERLGAGLPARGTCSATMSRSNRRLRRNQYPNPAEEDRPSSSAATRAWCAWSACSRTSIRVPWMSRGALRALGVQVAIGGFHVSGMLSMLPGIQPELQEAMDLGISLFAGEAEGRFEGVLRDAYNGTLKPLYNYMDDLPLARRRADADAARRPGRKRTGGTSPVSTPGAAVRSSALSAPSSTCRGAKSRRRSRRRHRGDRARNVAQGDQPLLHHRRQFRAQQGLGEDFRPADPAARGRKDEYQVRHPGGHACAIACRISSRRPAAPA